MQRNVVQNIGWYGVVAILLAYGLLSFGFLTSIHWAYLLLNLTGSIAIAIEAWSKRDKQPMVLNLIWAMIAVIGIIRLLVG